MQSKLCRLKSKIFSSTFDINISSLIPYWKASCANCTAARQHDSSVMQSLEATTCEVRTAQRLFLALPGDSGAHFPTNKNVLKVNNGNSRNR